MLRSKQGDIVLGMGNGILCLQNLVSFCFLCFIVLFIFFIRPSNKWHYLEFNSIHFFHRAIIFLFLISTIFVSIAPMSLSPYWTGSLKQWADKQQYSRMANALLQGHLYIDNGNIDLKLEEMDNPYDRIERERLGVQYNWDEAYYNHHYYMYFGIVPTIVLFIPFKLLTGTDLLSYQATQFFAALVIIGIFYLFNLFCKHFFQKFPFSLYLLLSSSFSILSIGYSIAAPALYCTAIVSGICFMVWSIICFLKGLWIECNDETEYKYLCLGSTFGALAFGCRPPVALANLLVLVVGYMIIVNHKNSVFIKGKQLLVLLLPYILVGIELMLYNYSRFDDVFEFGQSYQLTVADQHNYSSFLERFDLRRIIINLMANFYIRYPLSDSFPFLHFNGVFINFPILLLSVRIFSKEIVISLKQKKLYFISLSMLMISLLVTIVDIYWSPFLVERYRLDFYYLLCIVSFITIATWLDQVADKRKKVLLSFLTVLIFAVYVVEFLFFCLPYEGSYTACYPYVLEEIYKGLRFGL